MLSEEITEVEVREMPGYPPESSWNLPPTDNQVRAIMRAGKILRKDITEQDIPPTRWQARDVQINLWEQVRSKGKQTQANFKIIKQHDDGDITVECNDHKYVITTEGDIFQEPDYNIEI